MSRKIEITWLEDSNDCETCGTSWETGAFVVIEDEHGVRSLSYEPIAHCYQGEGWSRDEVYNNILKHLGYEVEEVDAKA